MKYWLTWAMKQIINCPKEILYFIIIHRMAFTTYLDNNYRFI